MICKLCLKEKKLLKKSHIIPKFMYKGLFDENHKILVSKVNPLKKEKLQSDGAYEKGGNG